MYARFAWLTLLNLLFTLLAFIVAPLVVPFASKDGWLPRWLCWFQTFDASLDAGWRDGYFMYSGASTQRSPMGFERYWLRVKWLWRNPAYGFAYWPCGLSYNPDDWYITRTSINPDRTLAEFAAYTKDGKHFCYTNDHGVKLGYKLWWALDADFQLLPRLGPNRGPDNRLPLCFTPF